MSIIGNNADTLLNGLSDFWHRFFRDIGDIQATYEGTEILLGQVYLNFLSDVLNTSVVETPLFRKEYFKLITVREDQLVFKERGNGIPIPPVPTFYGNPGSDRYVFTSDTFFGAIPQLQDVIFAPKTAITDGADYHVAGAEIQFKDDPTSPVLPGYAKRRVSVGIGGKFTGASVFNWVLAGVKKGDTLYYSEKIELSPLIPEPLSDAWVTNHAEARKATIVHVTESQLSVSVDTPFPTFPVGAIPTGFSWRIVRKRDDGAYNQSLPLSPHAPSGVFTDGQISYVSTLEVSEISMWAVNAKIDDLSIYKTYGYFFTNPTLSSETYRALVRGLMQLYIMGPAIARLESALNLAAALPTIREEGETLISYNSGILEDGVSGRLKAGDIFEVPVAIFSTSSVGGVIRISASDYANNIGTFSVIQFIDVSHVKLKPATMFTVDPMDPLTWTYTVENAQIVTTDVNVYKFPLITPMREDVVDPANAGILTFKAFEVLTTAIRVTDYISDPEWWHSITIPQEIMPDTSGERRASTPQLYPNVLGPEGNAMIGDPGFYIGMDEDGHIVNPPPADPPTRVPYRHNAAFILMDRFLKLHMFGVLIDNSVTLTGLLVNDLQKIIKDVKPVHTALYFQPTSTFRDVIDLTDELTAELVLRRIEELGVVNNELTIGSSWLIGDLWQFAGPVGGALTIGVGAGFIPAVVGGIDPGILPANPGNPAPVGPPEARFIDRPLYVYMHV